MNNFESIENLYKQGLLDNKTYSETYEKALIKAFNDKDITIQEYTERLKYIATKDIKNQVTELREKVKNATIKLSDFNEILEEQEKEVEKDVDDDLSIDEWRRTGNTKNGILESFQYMGEIKTKVPIEFLKSIKKSIIRLIDLKLLEKKGLKLNFTLNIEFNKIKPGDEKQRTDETASSYFSTKNFIIINDLYKESLEDKFNYISDLCERFEGQGSGWVIKKINKFFINFANYTPLSGGTYVESPEGLSGILNIQNKDNKCFLWSILAHKHQVKDNRTRVKNYIKYENEITIKEYPVSIDKVPFIEKNNNININVFGYEEKHNVFPLYITNNPYDAINLLLYNNHYILITDFNKLMFKFSKFEGKKHFCMRCLHCFTSEENLKNHIPDCNLNKPSKTVLPEEGTMMKFVNFRKKMKVPYVIYADFECITEKIDQVDNNATTRKYQKHIPSGFKLYITSIDPEFDCDDISYRGPDAHKKFLKVLFKIKEKLLKLLYNPPKKYIKDIIWTKEEEEEYKNATHCHICEQIIPKNGDNLKVRDHCHITGRYRGAAHADCNINFKYDFNNIPVIFHNLKGYDSHFIIKEANSVANKIKCISQNQEKMISFNLDQYKFIDSFQFMPSSLDSLVKNLKDKGIDYFKHTKRFYKGELLDLITRKGVYPYDYMDSFEKFEETELPPKESFYSQLSKSHISDSDYEHAKLIWEKFEIKNLGEYHDLYMKSDVLLLTDVFENFRETCINAYKLDPCNYLTAPGLSWDAMLYHTDIKLELIHDIDIYHFIEKGIRGGISVITHRHAKANNKYMKNYNPQEESSFITYLDANNLYGWAMIQKLPVGEFKWVDNKHFGTIIKYLREDELDDSDLGYILEVDIEYPEEKHDYYNDFPPCAENIQISSNMLSPYASEIADKFKLNVNSKIQKLCPNLLNKTNYVIHYKNLQQALDLGLIVTKVHRVLKFKQSCWLKPYIDFNTKMRTKATNNFEKDFYKLMNNSVFGKTMENVRNHVDGRLVNDEKKLKKLISKPSYKGNPIYYSKEYCYVEMHKLKVELNKPIYVGLSILEISKTLMYDFHYNYIKNKYNDNAKLLFQDTDSLTYHIKTEDLYQDFFNDKKLFDFSDFPTDNKFHNNENKKVIGKMKMEELNKPIAEFVGLRSKMYSVLFDNEKEKKTAKGIKSSVKDNEITHEDYRNVLTEKIQMKINQNTIRSNKHEVHSISQTKISLSCYDDKRYLKDDGISSFAYGHKNI